MPGGFQADQRRVVRADAERVPQAGRRGQVPLGGGVVADPARAAGRRGEQLRGTPHLGGLRQAVHRGQILLRGHAVQVGRFREPARDGPVQPAAGGGVEAVVGGLLDAVVAETYDVARADAGPFGPVGPVAGVHHQQRVLQRRGEHVQHRRPGIAAGRGEQVQPHRAAQARHDLQQVPGLGR